MLKACAKCGHVLPYTAEHFAKNGTHKGNPVLHSRCRSCRVRDAIEWMKRTGYKRRKTKRQSCPEVRAKNKARRNKLADAATSRRHRKTDRGRLSQRRSYEKNKFKKNFASVVRASLVRGKGGRSAYELIGYSVSQLKTHLERQFTVGMSWQNYGTRWHIDHIIPVSAFRFSTPDEPDFKACWALSNLRPLGCAENIRKRNHRTHLL